MKTDDNIAAFSPGQVSNLPLLFLMLMARNREAYP